MNKFAALLYKYTSVKNKSERLDAISKLLSAEEIGSQEELLQKLIAFGFDLTQATLSRDLKLLKVIKAPGSDGRYVYVMPGTVQPATDFGEALSIGGVLSLEFSGNLAVVKTRPGFANGIASLIDEQLPQSIIGTIAGDDTILMVLKEGVRQKEIKETLIKIIPAF